MNMYMVYMLFQSILLVKSVSMNLLLNKQEIDLEVYEIVYFFHLIRMYQDVVIVQVEEFYVVSRFKDVKKEKKEAFFGRVF